MRRLFLIAALFLWTPAGAQNDDATPRKIEKETFVYGLTVFEIPFCKSERYFY